MTIKSRLGSSIIVALMVATSMAHAAPYVADPAHSNISFAVRHMFAQVKGNFNDYTGNFDFDPKTKELKEIDFTIKTVSLNTNHTQRDNHLRAADFFDATQFPEIRFTALTIKKDAKGNYTLAGPLTLHGVSKNVTFTAKFLGAAKNPWGTETASFTATTKINRKDFGMSWNKAIDNGGVLIGNDVDITIDIEGMAKTTK